MLPTGAKNWLFLRELIIFQFPRYPVLNKFSTESLLQILKVCSRKQEIKETKWQCSQSLNWKPTCVLVWHLSQVITNQLSTVSCQIIYISFSENKITLRIVDGGDIVLEEDISSETLLHVSTVKNISLSNRQWFHVLATVDTDLRQTDPSEAVRIYLNGRSQEVNTTSVSKSSYPQKQRWDLNRLIYFCDFIVRTMLSDVWTIVYWLLWL